MAGEMRHASVFTGLCICMAICGPAYSARARKPAIIAPVNCSDAASCGQDITIDQAKSSYSAREHSTNPYVEKENTACLHGPIARDRKPIRRGAHSSDIVAKDACLTSETFIERNYCGDPATIGAYYFWAPADRFRDGNTALVSLESHARTGEPFGGGYQIIETAESTGTEQHFALCGVTVVSGQSGPPRGCTTVAIFAPDRTWLRGGGYKGLDGVCPNAAHFRLSGAIDISYTMRSSLGPLPLSETILRMLTEQLGLSAHSSVLRDREGNIVGVYITSSTGLRTSRILTGGWREALDFDLRIDKELRATAYAGMRVPDTSEATDTKIEVSGTAHALVSRLPLGSLTEYQGLSDAQRTAYATALDAYVNAALKSACVHYTQPDDATIIC